MSTSYIGPSTYLDGYSTATVGTYVQQTYTTNTSINGWTTVDNNGHTTITVGTPVNIGGNVTITGGAGGNIFIVPGLGGAGGTSAPANNLWPSYNYDSYGIPATSQKSKNAEELIKELKKSLLEDLDNYQAVLDGIDEMSPEQDVDKLIAKAEYNTMLLNAAAEIIKERSDKLKNSIKEFLTKEHE